MASQNGKIANHVQSFVSHASYWLGKVLIPDNGNVAICFSQPELAKHAEGLDLNISLSETGVGSRLMGLYPDLKELPIHVYAWGANERSILALNSTLQDPFNGTLKTLRERIDDIPFLFDGAILPVHLGQFTYTHEAQRAASYAERVTPFAKDFLKDQDGCLLAEPPLGTIYANCLRDKLAESGKKNVIVVTRSPHFDRRSLTGKRVLRVDSTPHHPKGIGGYRQAQECLANVMARELGITDFKLCLEYDPHGIADMSLGKGIDQYNPFNLSRKY